MSGLPFEPERLMHTEERRHYAAVAELVSRFPAYRAPLCFALLGQAIAMCDAFGVDADLFLAELRARYPRPPVLVPPPGGQS